MKSVMTISCALSPLMLAGALLSQSIQAQTSSYQQGIQQTIHQGTVTGIQDTSRHVLRWTGIPYAKAPVANLRWKAPQPAAFFSNDFDATRTANVCTQLQQGKVIGEENCLNLNIYRPDSADTKLPVLVYIHGGNNQSGTSVEFNPSQLSHDLNAVIVSINYRLGALGFNPLPSLQTGQANEDSGNFALLDMSAALQWMNQNITSFGGDSHNITVSGFSAGGRDVMAMLTSPLFKNQFQKAIVFSGGMTMADPAASRLVFAKAIAPLVVADRKQPDLEKAEHWLLSSDPAVKTYLNQLPAKRLAPLMGNAGIRMSVFPHLYRDGTVLPQDGFATTKWNQVPVMMISGQNEFSFFALSDPFFDKAFQNGSLTSTPPLLTQYRFAYQYGGQLYSLFNVQQSAEQMYAHYQAPIYGAEIAYGSDAKVTGKQMALLGSFHGIFLPFLDQNANKKFVGNAFHQPGAIALGNTFKQYLGNFIRQGNPNGKALPEWKTWTPAHEQAGQSLLVLDANRQQANIRMIRKGYTGDDLLKAIDADHSLPADAKQQMISQVLNARWFSEKLDQHFHNPSLWPAVTSTTGQ